MSEWFYDIAALSSVLSLAITSFLAVQVRSIRLSFLRRARLSEVVSDLKKEGSAASRALQSWDDDKQSAWSSFARIKALLENVKAKLPSYKKKQVNALLKKIQPRSNLLFRASLTELDEDQCWAIYTDLGTVIVSLEQLIKDSKWD